MDDEKRLEWADRLVRALAAEKCMKPVDMDGGGPIDCGEVLICGGMCLRCLAVRYVERWPEPAEAASRPGGRRR